MDFSQADQFGFQALLGDAAEESFEDLDTPSLAGLGEHAVIGNLVLQPEAKEPEVVDPQRQIPDQLPVTAYVVDEEQQHHPHQHDRIDRNIVAFAVELGDLFAVVSQVENLVELAEQMILGKVAARTGVSSPIAIWFSTST